MQKSTNPPAQRGSVTNKSHPRACSEGATRFAPCHGTCLAMTSHNSGEAQGRLISPRSASGGLQRGRFLALRSSPIPHRELCDVMPLAPKRAGRSRARPQNQPRCGWVTKAQTAASWRLAFRSSLPAASMRQSPKYEPLPPAFRESEREHEPPPGSSQRASPFGSAHAGCSPHPRAAAALPAFAGIAFGGAAETSVRQSARPDPEESLCTMAKRAVDCAHCRAG